MQASKKTLVLLLSVLLGASPLISGADSTPRIVENVTVTPGRTLSPADEAAISRVAVRVLNRIADARKAIARNEIAAARDQLRQADVLLDVIQAALPTTIVRDQVKVAASKLEYEDVREVQPDLVPIYAALDEIEDFAYVPAARAHLDKAKAKLKAGDKAGAKGELEAVDAALMYQELDLPLTATRQFIHAAQTELARGNAKLAEAHLQAAMNNVVYYSDWIVEPLLPAATSLARAKTEYQAGRRDSARAELNKAIALIERAARSADDKVKAEAQELLTDARALEQKLGQGAKVGESDLALVWARTRALADRTKDYLATAWARLHGGSELRKNLIEARLYARYTDIDAFIGRDMNRAQRDLGELARYLDAARGVKEIASDTLQRIDDIQKQVSALRSTGLEGKRAEVQALSAQLGQLLRQL